ncbi:MAG: macro domain-containing protein, partial [Bacteroidales bacterium]|nr:macro domain-containing protein [Bacteroidales bacterium]
LADCYRNALNIAEEKGIDSVAFPAISTGAFGYPFDAATDVALETIRKMIPDLEQVKVIRFVLFSGRDYWIYDKKLKELEK